MNETTAPPPAPRRPRLTAAALASVLLGGLLFCSWFWISLTLLLGGLGSLPALGSGLFLLVPWLLVMQGAVRIERRRAVAVHGIGVILPARRRSLRTGVGGWIHDRWLELGTGAFWRGTLHHHLAMLVAGAFFVLVLALLWLGWTAGDIALRHGPVTLGSLTLGRWMLGLLATTSAVLAVLALVLGALADRGLARMLISGSEDDLREQVAELVERRQGAVDASAQERLRIERDLHDGVQPRLVNLAMTLGMAKNTIHADPDRASDLVGQAHLEAKGVMTDLRQLARGIHPAVLTDRGLDAALSALAARSSIPVDLQVDLDPGDRARLDREREAVAYFVVSEALTNIAKHSAADSASVTVTQTPEALRVRVEDDGRGGARVHRDGLSTGLAGLTDRVRATGGRLDVTSPADGGTTLVAVIPLAPGTGAAATVRSAAPGSPAAPAGTDPQEVQR
ncbi:sensor histidine kinase [Brachybacterium fresconis]|uniref:histidine kinase n=1 Tax=Brachybacterium fresconis TaxID=173363 RepID=A0ABS4YQH7_9MICO|nr:histidine kinase [Brachybacterium fresconis]MBP2411048.1 signal transduction histidine kinase [Brachybacterium fresconis]